MAKQRTTFVCQQCGTESPKWMGKCPGCGEWNTMVEAMVEVENRKRRTEDRKVMPKKLSEIKSVSRKRIKTDIEEFDRVLGGGVVPGSMVLVAGEPGIGKSTLMVQLIAKTGGLYVSGEESLEQIRLRSQRLGITTKEERIVFIAETDVDLVVDTIKRLITPRNFRNKDATVSLKGESLVVIDSIQTMQTSDLTSVAGSIGQVRECTSKLLKIGKSKGISIFLVGHITKAGAIAGPKVLEHMVDAVVYFEGERFDRARLLRATKNRFGATDEVGIFEMSDKGLVEVKNPSKLFLKKRLKKVPGAVVVVTIEGTRPILTEIQALVAPSQLAVPRRIGRGVDYNRLQLITAVLAKRLGLPLGSQDIFVNVAGGLKIEEPAVDLAIALAIVSSFKNIALDDKIVAFGEVGLLGELREVSQVEKRTREARRLGFTNIVSPQKFISINTVAKKLLSK